MKDLHYDVQMEFLTAGPIAATATPDGRLVAIDFASLQDPSKALRLAIPAAMLESLKTELSRVQQALADPASGIRPSTPH